MSEQVKELGASHTLGPWRVVDGHTTVYPVEADVLAAGRSYVALTTTDTRNAAVAAQARADARLIAAAPGLLEFAHAVRRLANSAGKDRTFDDCSRDLMLIDDLARAIISKAEGAS